MGFFYGIRGIHFVSNGCWSDPGIIWHKKYYNYYLVEDAMYSDYRDYCEENLERETDDGFEQYMTAHQSDVRELLQILEDERRYSGKVKPLIGLARSLGYTHIIEYDDGDTKFINLDYKKGA